MSKLREAIRGIIEEQLPQTYEKEENPDQARILRCISMIEKNAHEIKNHLEKGMPFDAVASDISILMTEMESCMRVMRRTAERMKK